MGARSTATRATPYALIVRYTGAGTLGDDTPLRAFKTLPDALAAVTEYTNSWFRLIGGQTSPLTWLVIDVRDYSEWHIGPHPEGKTNDQQKHQGRWYHRRNVGTVVDRRRPGRRGGRSILDRYRL